MRHRFFAVAIQLAVLVTAATPISAAELSDKNWGRVLGKVVDAKTGKTLADVNVIVQGTVFGAATSSNGQFSFNLRPGPYTILIRSIGYEAVQEEILVIADKTIEVEISMAPTILPLPQVVVTGTRTERLYQDTPVLTEVITKQEIQNAGVTDLQDVLLEQTGLNIVHDHGQGVQVQGFDPDYTLILIDGSPVIGRVAGTLDLTRFSVANIERVEIVKGPNSSLYGSEALAGVINIITREPRQPLALNVNGRYGSFNSQNLSINAEWRNGGMGGSVFYDRKSRDHFDLNKQTITWSGPAFTDHTFGGNFFLRLTDQTRIKLNTRLFLADQFSIFGLRDEAGVIQRLEDKDNLTEWNISPILESQVSPGIKLTAKGYITRYLNDGRLELAEDGSVFNTSHFDQFYRQVESQVDFIFSEKHWLKLGTGFISESVQADRIAGNRQSNQTFLGFFQYEWLPSKNLDIIASARLDAHSEYGTYFSPKLALLWKFKKDLRIRGSFGSGFKAPNFSQLYLDFTNPTIGYSVFGAIGVEESLRALINRGEIQQVFIDPATLAGIDPESSMAFNFSVEATPLDFLHLRTNLFRNDVKDLIDVQPIARKTNNQSVFTYFNFNRVYTTGVEAEATVQLGKPWKLQIGYQYLIAKDKDVVEQLKNGEIFKKGSSGRIRPVLPAEYGGLFNRSRNSGTVKVSYRRDHGMVVNLRAILRGKHGLFDLNGNRILDDQSEYTEPYVLVNLHVAIPLTRNIALAAGVENAFDYVDERSFVGAPGRILYAKLNFNWQK
jgi:outer membrane receptor for ferrienterochelin and colicins